jgi:hypothetical protein
MTAATCSSCGATIIWAAHVRTRKAMPFDAEPVPGEVWRLAEDGDVLVAVHDPQGVLPGEDAYRPHWATCPHAATHRRR